MKKKKLVFKVREKSVKPSASLETKDIRFKVMDELSIGVIRRLAELNKRGDDGSNTILAAEKDQLAKVMFALNALREKI